MTKNGARLFYGGVWPTVGRLCVKPLYRKSLPGHRASWCEPSLSISGDGRLFAALVVVDATAVDPRKNAFTARLHQSTETGHPDYAYGVKDGGRRWLACWQGCYRRGFVDTLYGAARGHNEMNLPRLIYTRCYWRLQAEDAVTEIRMVSPHS